jgi:protein phosphatase
MKIRCSGRTDRGRVRPHNEDSLLADQDRGVLAVADGMGGHAAGEVASRLAIETVSELLDTSSFEPDGLPDLLRRAVSESNHRIGERMRTQPECRGMGTTLVVLVMHEGRFWIAHVGDSRAYLVRDGAIRQLTSDHSFVNELVRLGMLSREQAARDPRRNVVTRALGSGPHVEPDILEGACREGDLVLLCSDGLNTMLEDQEILAVIEQAGMEPDRASEALVDAANGAGGEDNVTVVVASCLRDGVADEREPRANVLELAPPREADPEPPPDPPNGPDAG